MARIFVVDRRVHPHFSHGGAINIIPFSHGILQLCLWLGSNRKKQGGDGSDELIVVQREDSVAFCHGCDGQWETPLCNHGQP